MMTTESTTLKRTLGSFRLWGIAVGLVISGEYFGWSYGWSQAGTMGFLIVALAIAAMYCAFIFSFTELTTAIPHAGGPLLMLIVPSAPQADLLPVSQRSLNLCLPHRLLQWPSALTSTCNFHRSIQMDRLRRLYHFYGVEYSRCRYCRYV
jgi:hypothetical protein